MNKKEIKEQKIKENYYYYKIKEYLIQNYNLLLIKKLISIIIIKSINRKNKKKDFDLSKELEKE